jgi:transposase
MPSRWTTTNADAAAAWPSPLDHRADRGAWLGDFRRLRARYERDSERFYALVLLACSVICFNALQRLPR